MPCMVLAYQKLWLLLVFLLTTNSALAGDVFIGNTVELESGLEKLVELTPSLVDNFKLSWKLNSPSTWKRTDELLKHDEPYCQPASGSLYRLLRKCHIIEPHDFEFYPVVADFNDYGCHAFLKIIKKSSNQTWYMDITVKQFERYNKSNRFLKLPKIFLGDLQEYKKILSSYLYNHENEVAFEEQIERNIDNAYPPYIFRCLTAESWIADCCTSLVNYISKAPKRIFRYRTFPNPIMRKGYL